MNYVYIVKCRDDSLYTGWTNNLEKRLKAHNDGKASKYTSMRLPVTLLYFETYSTKKEALKREYEIKQYSRKQKLELIRKNPTRNPT